MAIIQMLLNIIKDAYKFKNTLKDNNVLTLLQL